MPYSVKGEQRNTGRTHFKKGFTPWNKNKTGLFSEETRFKMGSSFRGKSSPMKGRQHTEETRNKIRLTLLAKNKNGKKLFPYWYHNNLWYRLRKIVYKRDGYRCQECGNQSNKRNFLQAHHIDYDVNNNKLSNLITLCNVCHGKINYKREEWVIYYKRKMEKYNCSFKKRGVIWQDCEQTN